MQKVKLMIELIKELFESNGYEGTNIEENILFHKNDKKDFWLLLQVDDLEQLIENQIDLLEGCKEVNTAPELEKNISMLILWDKGEEEFSNMKKKILPIEEDPYYFKKHILYFSVTELEEFQNEINENDAIDFVEENIVNYNIFTNFKDNPQAQTWQSLLYRLAIKLPFIKINIDETEDLDSLFIQNNIKIQNHRDRTLASLNSTIFELDTDDLDGVEILERLARLLAEENNNEH
jgi:hypothetical protein